jgi:WD40 repeat protein/serine/threonine protein kinase
MDRCPTPEQLTKFLADKLIELDVALLEGHVEGCSSCQRVLEQLTTAGVPLAPFQSDTSTECSTPVQPCVRDFLERLETLSQRLPAPGVEAELATFTVSSPAPGRRPSTREFPSISGYEIIGELGQGGMGVVYQAWQIKLRRVVALKLVSNSGNVVDLTRFRIEAEASARLHHPNIVQVFEVGEQDGCPFLALEYVAGSNLADMLRRTPLPARLGAHWIGTLAQAMSHAHERGIIHRDLKPANVLLQYAKLGSRPARNARDDTVKTAGFDLHAAIPKITDFGLAKLLVGGSEQTRSGTVMGTPSYMAPEQARGRTKEISETVDVYGLGAILYEVLTGRPPFRGESVADTLQQVLTDEPVAPRRLQANVPPELETICLKCLEKEPRRRYATAAVLAEDIRRFLANEPILAKPTPRWQLAWKWSKRHPAAAALILVILVAGSAILTGGLGYQARLEKSLVEVSHERDQANQARAETERQRVEADEQRDQARQNLYLANIPLAQRAWEAGRVSRMQDLLTAVSPLSPRQADLRSIEWHYLNNLCHTDLLTLPHAAAVNAVAYRFDGKRLASAGADGLIRIWDTASGNEVGPRFKRRDRPMTTVCYSPDGKRLAAGCADHAVLLWDAESGLLIRTLTGHAGWIYHVVFSPDGRFLATTSADKTIKVWNAETGEKLNTYVGHTAQVTGAAFSPDNKRLASSGADRQIRIWDLENQQAPRVLEGHSGWVYCVRFSPDGKSLASSSFDRTVRLWNAATGKETRKLLGHTGQVRDVVFSSDGKRLASAGFDQTVRLWDAVTGLELSCLKGHTDKVHGVSFSHDGVHLASASDDRTVKIWDVTRNQDFQVAQRHDAGPVTTLVFHPDGKRLFSAGADKRIRVWDLASAKELAPFKGHTGAVYALALAVDGKLLASGGSDRTIRVWDVAASRQLTPLKGHTARVTALAINPRGLLASASWDGSVRTWTTPDGKELLNLRYHAGRVLDLAFSPDGTLLASGGDDKKVVICDAASGQKLRTLEAHTGWVYCLAFSPDGKFLASAGEDGTIKLWDVSSGTPRASLEGHAGRVNRLAFSADGTRLASCGFFDKTVRIWHVARGQELLILQHADAVHTTAFSPGDLFLASAGGEPAMRLWNATPTKTVGLAPG